MSIANDGILLHKRKVLVLKNNIRKSYLACWWKALTLIEKSMKKNEELLILSLAGVRHCGIIDSAISPRK
jgi:hypothetical protein